jgi:hypothetical protein
MYYHVQSYHASFCLVRFSDKEEGRKKEKEERKKGAIVLGTSWTPSTELWPCTPLFLYVLKVDIDLTDLPSPLYCILTSPAYPPDDPSSSSCPLCSGQCERDGSSIAADNKMLNLIVQILCCVVLCCMLRCAMLCCVLPYVLCAALSSTTPSLL